MRIKIDQKINDIEEKLSNYAAIPIAGTLAGGAKVCLGVAQSFTALAIATIMTLSLPITGNWSTTKYAWSHVKHGLGNIAAGTVESIPLVGTVMWIVRKCRIFAEKKEGFYISTGQADKFMPYESLIKKSLTIKFFHEDKDGINPKLSPEVIKLIEAVNADCMKFRENLDTFDEARLHNYPLEEILADAEFYINKMKNTYGRTINPKLTNPAPLEVGSLT